MNKRLLTFALAACGGMVVSAGAFAQQATTTQGSQSTTATAQSSAATTTAPKQVNGTNSTRSVPPVDSNLCVRDTGSRLKRPKGQPCLPVNGNSYTQQDIQRTGATNVGQALQQLDPSVQVNGGH